MDRALSAKCQRMDSVSHRDQLARSKQSARSRTWFKRKPYETISELEYLRKKGVIADGDEEDAENV